MADRTGKIIIQTEVDTSEAVDHFDDLSAKAEDLARDIDALGDRVDNLGDVTNQTSAQVGGEFADSFARVQRNIDAFNQQLREVGDVGPSEIEKIVKSMALLDDEMRQAGKSIGDLDDETRKALRNMQDETDNAIKKTARLETAWESVENQSKSQVQSFTGIGDALEQLGGKAGAAAVKVGLIASAAKLGWQEGMALNKELQRDMSEWESLWEKLRVNVNLIISGWVNTILGSIQAVKAAWDSMTSGSFTKFTEGMSTAIDSYKTGLQQIVGGVTTFGEETEKVAAATGEITEKAKKKFEEEREALEKAREANEALGESKKDLADEIHTVNIALTEETAKIAEQAAAQALIALNDSLNNVQFAAAVAAAKLLTESFEKLTQQAKELRKELDALGVSTDFVAGGGSSGFGEGISVRRSGSDEQLQPGDRLQGGSL